jgi:hypothetical protein
LLLKKREQKRGFTFRVDEQGLKNWKKKVYIYIAFYVILRWPGRINILINPCAKFQTPSTLPDKFKQRLHYRMPIAINHHWAAPARYREVSDHGAPGSAVRQPEAKTGGKLRLGKA